MLASGEFRKKAVETAEMCVVSGAGGSVWNNYSCNAQVGGSAVQWVTGSPHSSRVLVSTLATDPVCVERCTFSLCPCGCPVGSLVSSHLMGKQAMTIASRYVCVCVSA